jgi:hypothetical protein
VARQMGIEVPEGETFDPVAAGLIPDPYDADEAPSETVTDLDRELKPDREPGR